MNLPLSAEHRARVEEFQRTHRIGLLTMVFTDIVDSTRLKQELGDSAALALMEDHHNLIRNTLKSFVEGQVIDTAGDSFFVVFSKPSDAVKFSLLVQSRLRQSPHPSGHRVVDRIGIHVGEVFIEESDDVRKPLDLYGSHVDVCARVMVLAAPDQILLSRFAFDSARPVLKGQDLEKVGALSWLNHGLYLLKGVEEPLEICEVGEVGKAPLAQPGDSLKARRYVSPEQEPVLGWRPALGQVVPNTKWTLEAKLGEGGFGEVWIARHENLKERRVYKFCFRADRVRSLKREVTLFRLLKERVGEHPNIVSVEDVFFDSPPFYIVMDFVEGKDLRAWCAAKGGIESVPMADRLEIIAQIADALQAAHDSGIIHRDIKPSNILVSRGSPDVLAKLTDFGIGQVTSRELLDGMTRLGFTETMMAPGSSTLAGTQMYMPPEILAGKPATPRSDIYSLGVVLFQLIVGDFTRPVTTDWVKQIGDPLLREDLERCFAGSPQDRFEGASLLAKALRSLESRRQAQAEEQAAAKARERAAYRRGIAIAASVGILIIALVAGLALFAATQSREAKRIAKQESAQKQRASENFDRAQKAVDDLVRLAEQTARGVVPAGTISTRGAIASTDSEGESRDDNSDSEFDNGGKPEPKALTLALADSAVENYEAFLKQAPDDPALKANLARLYQEQAKIYGREADLAAGRAFVNGGSIKKKLEDKRDLYKGVATEALGKSVGLLQDLSTKFPENSSHRENLATAEAALAQFKDSPQALELLGNALKIREHLAADAPGDLSKQQELADLLAQTAQTQTNPQDVRRSTETELRLREKLTGLAGTNSTVSREEWLKLARVYGREAELVEDPQASIVSLRKAISSINSFLNSHTNITARLVTNDFPTLALLGRFQARLADRLSRSGEAEEAIKWAQASLDTSRNIVAVRGETGQGDLIVACIELGEILTRLGRSQDAAGVNERAVAMLKAMGRSNQRYNYRNDRFTDAVSALEDLWNKMCVRALDASNIVQAVSIANDACDYWKTRADEYSSSTEFDALLTASYWRLHNLHRIGNRPSDAVRCKEYALQREKILAEREAFELLRLAQFLSNNLQQCPTNGLASFWRETYTEETLAVLRLASTQTILDWPQKVRQFNQLNALSENPQFQEIVASGTAWSETNRALISGTVDVSNQAALRVAAANYRSITMRGYISNARWTQNGKTLYMNFHRVTSANLSVYLQEVNRVPLEARLGLDRAEKLDGGYLEFRGMPYFYRGQLEVALNEPSQIIDFVAGNNESNVLAGASSARLPGGMISVADSFRLKDLVGRKALVQGTVEKARWINSRKLLQLHFSEAGTERFVGLMYADEADALAGELKDNPASALLGKLVRLRGLMTFNNGELELNISQVNLPKSPDAAVEAEIRDPFAELEKRFPVPADAIRAEDTDRIRAAVDKVVTVSGAVQSASWSRLGTILDIEFKNVASAGIHAVIFQTYSNKFTTALGGDPADILPGRRLDINGKVILFRDRPELVLNSPSQVVINGQSVSPVALTNASSISDTNRATLPAAHPHSELTNLPPGVIKATDLAALNAVLDTDAAVEGYVTKAQWSRSGAVLNIEIGDPDTEGLMVVVFKLEARKFSDAFGGDLADVLPDKRVRLRGKVKHYGGQSPNFKGRLQIALTDPSQLQIIPPQ